MGELDGKIALVTGAQGAIGSSIVERLLSQGCSVAAVDVMPSTEAQTSVHAIQADISRKSDVERAAGETVTALGGIDILVNAAGIVSTGSAENLSEDEWDRVLGVNLKSVFLMSQACIAPLRNSSGGRIISLSSILARNGGNARPWIDREEQNQAGNIAYGASKAGINALTAYLARELAADNITVNAIAPGPITTAMTTTFPDTLKTLIPVGRMGHPEEVAEMVTFLAGPSAAFITGEVININGGMRSD